MSLLFNRDSISKIKPAASFGCLQTQQMIHAIPKKNKFPRCKYCHSILFPLSNDTFDCPLCHPDLTYSEKSYVIPTHSFIRQHFSFIFDIMTPQKSVATFLSDLYNSMMESDRATIIFYSDRITYLKVESTGLLHFHTNLNPLHQENIMQYSISRQELADYVIPSFSSIYSLIPDDFSEKSNPYRIIEGVLSNLQQRPSIMILTCARPVKEITVDDSDKLGMMIAQSNSILHIAAADDFRRLSSIVHLSYGTVFSVSNVIPGNLAGLLNVSRSDDAIKIYGPSNLRIVKIIGGDGKGRASQAGMSLKIPRFVGGCIKMSVDTTKFVPEQKYFNIIESHKMSSGNILTLHKFSILSKDFNPIPSSNKNTEKSIIIKEFAERVLHTVWEGGDFNQAISRYKTPEIQSLIAETVLENVGNDLQHDILRLYHVMLTYGFLEIKPLLTKSLNFFPPIILWDGKGDKEEMVKFIGKLWPYEFRFVENLPELTQNITSSSVISSN